MNPQPLRVLFVTPYYEPAWVYGGPTRSIAGWARALVATGCEVDVYTTTANGQSDLKVPTGIPILRDGVRVTYFPRLRASGNRFFSSPLWFACFQHAADYDVVHTVGLWTFPSAVGSLAASLRKVPYVISTHGTLMPWAYNRHPLRKRFSMALIERRRLARAACGICASPMELDSVARLGLFRRLELVPNIVEIPQDFAKRKYSFLLERLKLKDAFVFLFAGRLVNNKGVHLAIGAFMRVCQSHPQAKFIIVGPDADDTGQILRNLVNEQGMSDRVCFTGMLEGTDYWDAIASADIFVLSSFSENFGMSVAEAMALGVPVLISEHVGIADWIRQYDAGIITTLEIDCIAAAMNRLLAQKNELPAMGKRGKRLVEEQFSSFAVGRRYADLLEDIVRYARSNIHHNNQE